MPRKRLELGRDEKVAEILDLAVGLLRDGDPAALTVNEVAETLGVGRAAVYWYFPSRDDLFVAAARRLFDESFASVPARAGVVRKIEWAVDMLGRLYPAYVELQQLAANHREAADLLARFQRRMCDALQDVLAPYVEPERRHDVADTFYMFVEGLLGRRLPSAARKRNIRFALAALVPDLAATCKVPSAGRHPTAGS